mgnify:FL=1
MVAVAILAVFNLIVATLFSFLSMEFNSTRDRFAAEEMAARAESVMTLLFSQAINVEFLNGNPTGDLAANRGRIRDAGGGAPLVYDQIGDIAAPGWATLAIFQREMSPANFGTPIKTAVFFRRPEPTTSGMIFIDPGSNTAADMRPNYSDEFLDRIVFFRMEKRRHATLNVTTRLDFTIRFRYHLASTRTTTWCPQLDRDNLVAGCTNVATYRDIERNFSVLLRNNLVRPAGAASMASTGSAFEERVLGNLFFFRAVIPRR